MEWQPIETAPKDGTDVLLFFPTYKRQVHVGHYNIRETFTHGKLDSRSEGWITGLIWGIGDQAEPSHWMAIPAGPNQPEQASGTT